MSTPAAPGLPPCPDDDDDMIVTCWCGAKGTYEELFDDDGLDEDCGGTGYLHCYCGGDQCVCHRHGQEVECNGCEFCGDGDGFDLGDDGYDDE